MWRTHPEVAGRDCHDCLRHVYDHSRGERLTRHSQPIPRPPGTFAPCHYGRCAKGSPNNGGLSQKNKRAWLHFLECDAVGRFSEDAIVKRNAALIRLAMDSPGRAQRDEASGGR